jgi:hypothetical protein
MRINPSKPFFFLVAFCLAFATQSSAQQDSVAVDTAAAADTLAAIVAQVDSLTAQQPDSAVATDSLGAHGDTDAARLEAIDSVGAAESRPAARSSAKPKGPKRKPASSAGAIPVEVIDWDWDDYTHVTAVGFRHLDTDREYELERNEVYMEIWERQKGQQLWAWGESSNLGGGFWAFAPEKFEPLLTLAAADSIATADSVARADSIVTALADSIAVVDSIATADSIATSLADSIAATTDTTAATADTTGAAAPAPAAGAPAQPAVAPAAGSTAPQGTPPAAATPEPADTAKAPPAKDKLPPSGTDSTTAPPQAESDSSGGDKGSGGPQP